MSDRRNLIKNAAYLVHDIWHGFTTWPGRPRIRDRIWLATVALVSPYPDLVATAADRVCWPPEWRARLEHAYDLVDAGDVEAATALYDELCEVFDESYPALVRLSWELEFENSMKESENDLT